MSARRGDAIHDKVVGMLTPEWRRAEEVVQAIMPQVPPGKALRKYQSRSAARSGTRAPLSEDEQIESGRRAIVNERLNGSSRVEVATIDGVRMVRLRDRRATVVVDGTCSTCARPFTKASEETKPRLPAPRPTVVYPHFPSWEATLHSRLAGDA